MNKEEILVKFSEIFRTVLENPAIELKFEDTANDVDGWDSITNLYLVEAIEKEFDIKLSLEDVLYSKNVSDLCDIVNTKANGN